MAPPRTIQPPGSADRPRYTEATGTKSCRGGSLRDYPAVSAGREASIRVQARRHRVHRRTVRRALRAAEPPPRRISERAAPAIDPHRVVIRRWLIEDLAAPRKQRHAAPHLATPSSTSTAPAWPSRISGVTSEWSAVNRGRRVAAGGHRPPAPEPLRRHGACRLRVVRGAARGACHRLGAAGWRAGLHPIRQPEKRPWPASWPDATGSRPTASPRCVSTISFDSF